MKLGSPVKEWIENEINYSVQYLKVVEMYGYNGYTIEVDLIKWFLKNVVSLEKISVDPFNNLDMLPSPWDNQPAIFCAKAEIKLEDKRRKSSNFGVCFICCSPRPISVLFLFLGCVDFVAVICCPFGKAQFFEGIKLASTTELHKTDDRISELPDEILTCILSFLKLKEAGRTSVLSKRWKHAWTYVPDLDFDTFTIECYCDKIFRSKRFVRLPARGSKEIKRLKRERCKFVNWVNKVVDSHQTMRLNKFRIYNHFDDSFREDMNKWLQYAFNRGVERLEVDLWKLGLHPSSSCGSYVFPSTIVTQRSWSSLKVLVFNNVNVSGSDLESFLHNCKFIESLVVRESCGLKTLEVFGPQLALQHLEILNCTLESITVCNANLYSLKIDVTSKLVLKNVPSSLRFTLWTIVPV
ncbi:OLC1v1036880C1 [Oldenlandia corymbosa var. corymbosa]|uniref:OLC1v1036880C1 n=1 Tax=Oldenlandia corymbosa var. corymbosa TaxID=529605 RepID=A0AAV1CX95_OLDCO|nr:OLC1v1036880C1 [Oldenlandia corymbosa var. corymbosa]